MATAVYDQSHFQRVRWADGVYVVRRTDRVDEPDPGSEVLRQVSSSSKGAGSVGAEPAPLFLGDAALTRRGETDLSNQIRVCVAFSLLVSDLLRPNKHEQMRLDSGRVVEASQVCATIVVVRIMDKYG